MDITPGPCLIRVAADAASALIAGRAVRRDSVDSLLAREEFKYFNADGRGGFVSEPQTGSQVSELRVLSPDTM